MMSPTSHSVQTNQISMNHSNLITTTSNMFKNGFYPSPSSNNCHSPTNVQMLPSSISDNSVTMSAFAPGDGDIPNDPGKMFIGGLSWQTTPESIREYFSIFGELAEVMVMKDPATRRSRGFGFITFSDPVSVEKVLSFPVHQLDGKNVEPKVAVPRKTNPKLVMRTKKIFVGGLSAKTSLEDVKSYFEQFSMVKDAMLAYDKLTNRHRGFGFVTFDNDEVVDKICEIHYHEINGKMVESKKAIPRGGTNGFMSAPMNYVNGYNGPSYGRNIYGYNNGSYGNSSPQSAGGGGTGGGTGGFYDSGREQRGYLDSNAYYSSRHHPFDSLAENISDQPRYYSNNTNTTNHRMMTNGKFTQQHHYYNERNFDGANNNEDDEIGFHGYPGGGGRMVSSNGSTGSSGNNLDDFPPLNNSNNNNHVGLISSP